MRAPLRYLALSLLIFLAAPALVAQETARNPLGTATDIRAARGATTTIVSRVVYRDEAGGRVAILVGSDYAVTEFGAVTTIHDFRLRRALQLDTGNRRFINRSAYSIAGFSDYELHNRQMLKGILAAGGADVLKAAPVSIVDDFWIETDLSHSKNPAAIAGAALARSGNAFTVEYRGQRVATFQPAEQRFPDAILTNFYRALRHVVVLHPGIIAEMRKTGQLPQELIFTSWRPMQDRTQKQLSLLSIDEVEMDYPLASDYVPVLDERLNIDFRTHYAPLVIQALTGAVVDTRSTKDAYQRTISASLSDGQNLDAALLALEMTLALTEDCNLQSDVCDLVRDTFVQTRHDPAVISLLTAKDQEHNKQYQAAIETLRGISRAGLRYGHILDLFIANNIVSAYLDRMATAREADKARFSADVRQYFGAALRGNMFLAGTYKDFGNFYFRQFNPQEAWFLWDAGRSLPGRKTPSLLDAIGVFERGLEQNYPWLF